MRAALVILAMTLLTGCASMFSDNKYPVSIQSSPPGANFQILDQDSVVIHRGKTPSTVILTSNDGAFDGEFYTFKFQKEGYEDASVTMDSGADGWFFANILLGGLIGMTIDLANGSAFTLDDKAVASLKPLPQPEPVASTTSYTPAALTKEERIRALMNDSSLGYEEYMRQVRAINAE